jgi:catechol 2,3-dioxygenase-like lactoylglutathione lyase family enzyme
MRRWLLSWTIGSSVATQTADLGVRAPLARRITASPTMALVAAGRRVVPHSESATIGTRRARVAGVDRHLVRPASGLVQYHRPEMSAITDLFAGVPVSDLDTSIDWYTRFFGRPPDRRVGEEILWEIDQHAWLFIEPNVARAGAGRITFAVAGLDALLERLAAERIKHEQIETYSNGVRHVNVPDPDGNAIAFAEPPDAASASPRSAGPGASS